MALAENGEPHAVDGVQDDRHGVRPRGKEPPHPGNSEVPKPLLMPHTFWFVASGWRWSARTSRTCAFEITRSLGA